MVIHPGGSVDACPGFSLQESGYRIAIGFAPWVKLLHAQAGLAAHAAVLVEAAQSRLRDRITSSSKAAPCSLDQPDRAITTRAAAAIYQAWLNRLRIPQRFPRNDWSIADKWIAKELLWRGIPAAQVQAIRQLGSPGFPHCHANPGDYLRRTIERALAELESSPFPGLGLFAQSEGSRPAAAITHPMA